MVPKHQKPMFVQFHITISIFLPCHIRINPTNQCRTHHSPKQDFFSSFFVLLLHFDLSQKAEKQDMFICMGFVCIHYCFGTYESIVPRSMNCLCNRYWLTRLHSIDSHEIMYLWIYSSQCFKGMHQNKLNSKPIYISDPLSVVKLQKNIYEFLTFFTLED